MSKAEKAVQWQEGGNSVLTVVTKSSQVATEVDCGSQGYSQSAFPVCRFRGQSKPTILVCIYVLVFVECKPSSSAREL